MAWGRLGNMKTASLLWLLAFVAGALIPVQAAANAALSKSIQGNVPFAALTLFIVAGAASAAVVLLTGDSSRPPPPCGQHPGGVTWAGSLWRFMSSPSRSWRRGSELGPPSP